MFQIVKLLTGLLGNRRPRGGSAPGGRRGGRRPTISWRPSPSTVRMIVTAAIIAALFVGLFVTASFWVNWWWFGSIGYRSVLLVEYLTRFIAFIASGIVAAAFFAANWRYALRRAKLVSDQEGVRASAIGSSRFVTLPLWALTIAIAVVTGSAAANRWQIWLLWLNGRDFNIIEPIFNHDAGFYVFALPGLTALHQGAIALVLVTMLVVAVLYVVRLGLSSADLRRPPRAVRTHVLALAGGIILLLGTGYLLANYRMLYETHSVFYGPGYTNVNVERWANYALALLSAGAAALLLLNAWVRRLRLLLIAFIAWAVVGVLLGQVLPAVVQQAVVDPNEQRRERAYVDNNIELTLAAFDLDAVDRRELAGQGVPDLSDYSPTSPIFDNIRLWDYRIILDTFQQLRTFVNYYRFQDVDVDRYEIDGRLRQVVISARELYADGLPETAQTWNNRHLVYTHGYGAVVSPVSEVTPQDLPVFLVDDIPPQGTGALEIDRPEIYFGEAPSDWVAVNTELPEVSGISGETEAEAYSGEPQGSIGVGNSFQRLIMAVYLQDRRIILGNPMTDESRILIRRQIVDRAEAIAPFLSYDPDPYLVILDGRLVWVIDAYTSTDRFPGATPIGEVNYVRHSVKVVIDAYNGEMIFYRTGVDDAIADAYSRSFPELFTPIEQAPEGLAAHFRYPERLFDLQAEIYASYHVTDPIAFYNSEDRWQIASEEVESERGDSRTRRIEAYYVTLPLPGDDEPGFGLVIPFTPIDRPNMTAWMAGQTDDFGVPRLVAYRFPRRANIFGPQQIDAQINQNTEISAQITLLDQEGSRVIRGNLLVIPIGEEVLYAQPLYLQATGAANAATELKFVILATNDGVVMRATLPEAIDAVRAGDLEATVAVVDDAEPENGDNAQDSGETRSLAQEAVDAFDRSQEALARGDWTAYGEAQAELGAIIEQLAGDTVTNANGSNAEPAAGATPAP